MIGSGKMGKIINDMINDDYTPSDRMYFFCEHLIDVYGLEKFKELFEQSVYIIDEVTGLENEDSSCIKCGYPLLITDKTEYCWRCQFEGSLDKE